MHTIVQSDFASAVHCAALAGWYVADLMSGLVHMNMDYRPCPPGVGLTDMYFYAGSRESEEYLALARDRMGRINALQRVIYDFKNHHPRPDTLGRWPLWRLIGSTVIVATLPLSLMLLAAQVLFEVPGWVVAGVLALLIGGAFAQYFHGSLHRRTNPAIIASLRSVHLLMTPDAPMTGTSR